MLRCWLIVSGLSPRHSAVQAAVLHARSARPPLNSGGGEELNYLAEAAQFIEATDEWTYEAELHRLRGDLEATDDRVEAEQNYHRALAVARQQSAKSFELRAATSLAHLWHDQGKCAEVRDLRAPIYKGFYRRLRHAGPQGGQGAALHAAVN